MVESGFHRPAHWKFHSNPTFTFTFFLFLLLISLPHFTVQNQVLIRLSLFFSTFLFIWLPLFIQIRLFIHDLQPFLWTLTNMYIDRNLCWETFFFCHRLPICASIICPTSDPLAIKRKIEGVGNLQPPAHESTCYIVPVSYWTPSLAHLFPP